MTGTQLKFNYTHDQRRSLRLEGFRSRLGLEGYRSLSQPIVLRLWISQRNGLVNFYNSTTFLSVVFASKKQSKQVGKMPEIKKNRNWIELDPDSNIQDRLNISRLGSDLKTFGETGFGSECFIDCFASCCVVNLHFGSGSDWTQKYIGTYRIRTG